MTFLFLFLMLAVLNLALGYGTAHLLGAAPPGLKAAWEALTLDADSQRKARESKELDDFLETNDAIDIEQLLDIREEEDDDYNLQAETYEDAETEGLFNQLGGSDLEVWDIDEKYVEMSILKLNIVMMKSGKHATQLDAKLRARRGRFTAEFIHGCLAALRTDCENYLFEQQQLAERFSKRIDEMGELAALGEEIETTNLEQAAQIETTLSNLEHMDFETNLEAAGGRLIAELNNLRIARHRLRDTQEDAFIQTARCESRLEATDKRLLNDPISGLYNRIGLEVTLLEWWKKRMHTKRQMSAMLMDIDAFGEANDKYGHETCDKVLRNFGEWFEERAGRSGLAARFAGNQFLLLLRDLGPNAATKEFELMRQTLQRRTFRVGDQSLKLTISSGITEIRPEDSSDTIVTARLLEALKEAKRCGPNVAALAAAGKEPTLIESPSFGIEESTVELQ